MTRKTKHLKIPGTLVKQLDGTGVALCCMEPDRRDCLDRAMEEWAKHKKNLPKRVMGKRYRPDVYAFAYWLIRWSGIVKPS